MAKMGRPQIEISQKTFENLCQLQCTLLEICSFLDVTDKTLNSWCRRTYGETFSEVFKKKRVGGLVSLRWSQFELAKKNPAMAIFLGKNLLGQTDNILIGEHGEESNKTPSGFMTQFLTELNGEDSGDEQQNT